MSQRGGPFEGEAWLIFLIVGVINVVQGSLLMFFGGEVEQNTVQRLVGLPWAQLAASNPPFAAYVEDLLMIVGLFLAGFGLLAGVIACTGYRRRQPWAWYSMWIVPAFYLIAAVMLFERGEIYFSDDLSYEFFSFLLLATFLTQLLGARSFRRSRPSQIGQELATGE